MTRRFDDFNNDEDNYDDDYDREDEENFDEETERIYDKLEKIFNDIPIEERKFNIIIKIYEQSSYILKLLSIENKLELENKQHTKEYEENHSELIEALNFEKELYLNVSDLNLIRYICSCLETYFMEPTYYLDNGEFVNKTNVLNDNYCIFKQKNELYRMKNYFDALLIPKIYQDIDATEDLLQFWNFDELRYVIKKIDDFSINFAGKIDENLFNEMKKQYTDLKAAILFSSNVLTNNYILGEKLIGFDFIYDIFQCNKFYDKELMKFKNAYSGYAYYRNALCDINILFAGAFDITFYYQTLLEYNLSFLTLEQIEYIKNEEISLQELKKGILYTAFNNSIKKKIYKKGEK